MAAAAPGAGPWQKSSIRRRVMAGAGKLGAFIGVFLFSVLVMSLGLRHALLLAAAPSPAGCARGHPTTADI